MQQLRDSTRTRARPSDSGLKSTSEGEYETLRSRATRTRRPSVVSRCRDRRGVTDEVLDRLDVHTEIEELADVRASQIVRAEPSDASASRERLEGQIEPASGETVGRRDPMMKAHEKRSTTWRASRAFPQFDRAAHVRWDGDDPFLISLANDAELAGIERSDVERDSFGASKSSPEDDCEKRAIAIANERATIARTHHSGDLLHAKRAAAGLTPATDRFDVARSQHLDVPHAAELHRSV